MSACTFICLFVCHLNLSFSFEVKPQTFCMNKDSPFSPPLTTRPKIRHTNRHNSGVKTCVFSFSRVYAIFFVINCHNTREYTFFINKIIRENAALFLVGHGSNSLASRSLVVKLNWWKLVVHYIHLVCNI